MPRPNVPEPRTLCVVIETAMGSVAFVLVLALVLSSVLDTRADAGPTLDTWRKSEIGRVHGD